jgi:hypothetical protein
VSYQMDFRTALDEDMRNKGTNERLLGQMLGVTQQSINKWRQRGFPPLYRIEQLIQYFGPNSHIARIDFNKMVREMPRARVVPPAGTPGTELLPAYAPPPDAVRGLGHDRATWAREQELQVRRLLPPALSGHWEQRMMLGNAAATFDFVCDRLVLDVAAVPPGAQVIGSPSKSMLLLAAARMVRPGVRAVYGVLTDCPDTSRMLPQPRVEAAKLLGVEVIFFRTAHELAVFITQACGLPEDEMEDEED